jgi:D-alanine-D-alanine ligase and related ATP-grasp enzymes
VRICLLTNQDLDADPFPDDDWPCDPRPYLPEAEWHVAVLEKRSSVRTIKALARDGFDLFFNLCDGAADEESPGIEVIRTLEKLSVPFTGSTSAFYEPSRVTVKRVCRRLGVATPAYVRARGEADVERAAERLRFPLFVKHHSSYASIDLSRASRVVTPAGLRRQARKIMARRGKALIEEFIEGVECTVLVAENPRSAARPTTYPPIRYDFPEGESFKHSDMKWVDYEGMAEYPVRDAKLAARLRREAATVFVGLKGAGFGRCDFRVDEAGTPYLLEINANCGICYPLDDAGGADLCLLHDPGGHAAFTRQLVAAALKRC